MADIWASRFRVPIPGSGWRVVFLPAFVLAIGWFGTQVLSAGFDCAKARSTAAKLVCGDPDVSRLDDRLASAYASHLSQARDREAARRAQQRWLAEIRDRCEAAPCLRTAYRERLREIESTGSAGKHCPLAEADLIGAWERRSGPGFFEEMAFGLDGSRRMFDSWLHQRPEISGGSWRFERCTIHMRHPTEEALSVVFRVTGYRNGRLRVTEEGEADESVYRKMK